MANRFRGGLSFKKARDMFFGVKRSDREDKSRRYAIFEDKARSCYLCVATDDYPIWCLKDHDETFFPPKLFKTVEEASAFRFERLHAQHRTFIGEWITP